MYIQWNIVQPFKKNEIMSFAATWMDTEIIILSEVGQTEKDKCHMIITYMWNLKNDTDGLICKTETDSETSGAGLWLPKGRGGEEG